MHSLATVSINAENSLLHRYVDENRKGTFGAFSLNVDCNPNIFEKTIPL
jgi:hypothetical protein